MESEIIKVIIFGGIIGGGIPAAYYCNAIWQEYKLHKAIEEDNKSWQNDPAQRPRYY